MPSRSLISRLRTVGLVMVFCSFLALLGAVDQPPAIFLPQVSLSESSSGDNDGRCIDLPAWMNPASFTFEAWVNVSAFGSSAKIFSAAQSANPNQNSISLQVVLVGGYPHLQFALYGSGADFQDIGFSTLTTSLDTSKPWHHVAAVLDGAVATAPIARIYVDGVQAAFVTSSLTGGLVRHYTFDDANAPTADSSPANVSGTFQSGATRATNYKKYGAGALSLGDANVPETALPDAYFKPGTDTTLPSLPNTGWTLTGWFLGIRGPGSWRTLFRGDNNHQLIIKNDGYDVGYYNNAAGTGGFTVGWVPAIMPGSNPIVAGWTGELTTWHFIAGVYNGQKLDFYVDNATTPVGTITGTTGTHNLFAIGAWQGGGSQGFARYLDDIRVFNTALSPARLADVMNNVNIASVVPSVAHDQVRVFYGSVANQALGGAVRDIRLWDVARSATQIRDAQTLPLTGTETGLRSWYKCEEQTDRSVLLNASATPNYNGTLRQNASYNGPGHPYASSAQAIRPFKDALVIDPDTADTVNAAYVYTITITADDNPTNPKGALSGSGLSAAGPAGSGPWTLSAMGRAATETALRNLTFTPLFNPLDLEVAFTLTGSDGVAPATSAVSRLTITDQAPLVNLGAVNLRNTSILSSDAGGACISYPDLNNFGTPCTLEAWVWQAPEQINRETRFFSIATAASQSDFFLGLDAGNRLLAKSANQSANGDLAESAVFPAGEWNHVAVVWPGSPADAVLLRNGTRVHSRAGNLNEVAAATRAFVESGRGANAENYFNGQMKDLRIWNVARSDGDIRAYRNRRLVVNTPGLVAWYPCLDTQPAGRKTLFNKSTAAGVIGDATLTNHAEIATVISIFDNQKAAPFAAAELKECNNADSSTRIYTIDLVQDEAAAGSLAGIAPRFTTVSPTTVSPTHFRIVATGLVQAQADLRAVLFTPIAGTRYVNYTVHVGDGLSTLTNGLAGKGHAAISVTATLNVVDQPPFINLSAIKSVGSASPIERVTVPGFAPSSAATFEAWVKIDSLATSGGGLFEFRSGADIWSLARDGARDSWKTLTSATPASTWTETLLATPITTWRHVAHVVDSGGQQVLYINGRPAAWPTGVLSVPGTNQNTANYDDNHLLSPNGGVAMAGEMRDIRIWNVARTQKEIWDHMCTFSTPGAAGLVAWYEVSETSGTVLVNKSTTGLMTGDLGGGVGAGNARLDNVTLTGLTRTLANAACKPFASAVLVDPDTDAPVSDTYIYTITITSSGGYTNFTLAGTGLTGAGPYTLTATGLTQAQQRLRELVFTGATSWTGSVDLTVKINDAHAGGDSLGYALVLVTANSGNQAPTLALTPLPAARVGVALTPFFTSATMSDGDASGNIFKVDIALSANYATVALPGTALGTLLRNNALSYTLTVTGTLANLQASLRSLIVTPIAAGSLTFTFTVTDNVTTLPITPVSGAMVCQASQPAFCNLPALKMSTFDACNSDRGDYATLPAITMAAGTNLTLEAWVYSEAPFDNNNSLYDLGDATLNARILFNASTGRLQTILNNVAGAQDLDGLSYPMAEWNHVAAVFVSNGPSTLYRNGELTSTGASVASVAFTAANGYIGRSIGALATDRYFRGQMKDFRIWTTARTQDQIRSAMTVPLAGSEAGLWAWYQTTRLNIPNGSALPKTAGTATGDLLMRNGTVLTGQLTLSSPTPVFAAAILRDPDSSAVETATYTYTIDITLDTTDGTVANVDAVGALSGTGLTKMSVGTYRLTATSLESTQALLRNVLFTPTAVVSDRRVGFGLAITDDHANGAFSVGRVEANIIPGTAVLHPPVCTVLPVISGTPVVGWTLTCTSGSWNDAADILPGTITHSYQWFRVTAGVPTAITTASVTGSTYVVQAADQNALVTCQVTATANDLAPNTASAWAQGFYIPTLAPVAGVTLVATAGSTTIDLEAHSAVTTPIPVIYTYSLYSFNGSTAFDPAVVPIFTAWPSPPGANTNTDDYKRAVLKRAGSYVFRVTATNDSGKGRFASKDSLPAVAGQVATAIGLSPAGTIYVPKDSGVDFVAKLLDQFNNDMATQPGWTTVLAPLTLGNMYGLHFSPSQAVGAIASGNLTVTANGYSGIAGVTTDITVTNGFSAKINFLPRKSPAVRYYWLADCGDAYANRGNGMSYGWIRTSDGAPYDMTNAARDRNDLRGTAPSQPISTAPPNPDGLDINQMWDTCIHMQRLAGSDADITQYLGAPTLIANDTTPIIGAQTDPRVAWEIAVPNATYSVTLICGDTSYVNSQYDFYIETERLFPNPPIPRFDGAYGQWLKQTIDASVTDGKLTISNGPGARNNKICGVVIQQISAVLLAPN